MPGHLRHTSRPRHSTGALPTGVVGAAALALALGGCAGRGSVEDGSAGDAATAFLAAVVAAPQGACDLLAPATLEVLRSDGDDCAAALAEVAPDVAPSAEPTVEVYGRDAIVAGDGPGPAAGPGSRSSSPSGAWWCSRSTCASGGPRSPSRWARRTRQPGSRAEP